MNTRRIYLTCDLSQGSFSGEVVFSVPTVDFGEYVGVAPRRDCVKENGSVFGVDELPAEGTVKGRVATRLVSNGGGVACVALPDGEAVCVSITLVTKREIGSYVSI